MNRLVFPAVEPGSPVHPQLQQLRTAIASEPALAVADGARVRADLRPRSGRNGVEVGRFYWSVQRQCATAPLGFRARTLHYRRADRAVEVRDLPDDPVMTWLTEPGGPLRSHGSPATVRILRYIPLRRMTFLLQDAPGLPDRVIAKTQSRSALVQAAGVLDGVAAALAARGGADFRVPRHLGVDASRRLLYLQELPGQPLSRIHAQVGTRESMQRLGHLHRQLHQLDVEGCRVRRIDDWFTAAVAAAGSVTTLVPSVADRVQALLDALASGRPDDRALAFCQGDFVPSQILCHDSGWSVLDLDDGHLSDPYAEITALYTALARELSIKDEAWGEEMRREYLESYLAAAGEPFDRPRWSWFLTVARIRFLARRLLKGRAVEGEAQTMLSQMESSSAG